MQKLVYVSNSRDFTNQKNVNENRYFKHINELLDQGWRVDQIVKTDVTALDNDNSQDNKESFAAFVVLDKL